MTSLVDLLVSPLGHDFMVRALIVGLAVAVVAAVMSCFLVLKGWALMGDAVCHAVLPGIVLAFVTGLPIALGAFGAGLACALSTGWLQANSRVKSDAALGIVFSGMFGLGLVLYSLVDTDMHLMHILFGNMLGVSGRDIAETLVIGAACLAFAVPRRRDLLLAAFDPGHARAVGINVRLLETGLLIALALAIVVSMKAVGIILVVAMLIGPGVIAQLLTERFDRMMLIAVAVATGATLIGTLASFHLDAATGACIVLVQALVFVAALVFAPKRGLLAARARRLRAAEPRAADAV